MEQAYVSFNSGKYKEALNILTSNNINIDSYEPNLAICEYLTNRCTQSSLNCLRKLNDLILKKIKRDTVRMDCQTESIIKLNIAILLMLMGKQDNALLVLQQIYNNRECFIEFTQSRVFLLLMEVHVNLKNSFDVLAIYKKYLLKPVEQRQVANQWISIILHEHNKAYSVSREEFIFMTKVLLNQALIQLGVSPASLTSKEEDEKNNEELLMRVKKRKNNINKYYQINVVMISRFLEAQKQFHAKNYSKSLSLLNFVNIVGEFEQMPSTKIITNILNAFATSNTGLVHFAYEKPIISLSYFIKAKALLSKACTGVEDKDLQLFSINYANHNDQITYNIAMALLASKPKESYSTFESIRKANQISKNYKYWYRIGQAILEHFHHSKIAKELRKPLLKDALTAFTNCLSCIEKLPILSLDEMKKLMPQLAEDELESIFMRITNDVMQFRHSAASLVCYVSLYLDYYYKVIKLAEMLLQDKKLSSTNRVNILHYMLEAFMKISKSQPQIKHCLSTLQKQTAQIKDESTRAAFSANQQETLEQTNYECLYYQQLMAALILEGNILEAWKYCEIITSKYRPRNSSWMTNTMAYFHQRIGLHPKFMQQFVTIPC